MARVKQPLPVSHDRRAAVAYSRANPGALPPGALDPAVVAGLPALDRPPVVLVHGTNGRAAADFFTLAPFLANRGLPVFAHEWRRHRPGPGDPSATHVHAVELAGFLAEVRAATGASAVDVVGHSWGAVITRYALRCLEPEVADGVRGVVGVAPTYAGTSLNGLARFAGRLPASRQAWLDAKIPSWREQLPGSAVLRRIHRSEGHDAHVRWTTIVTPGDRAVTPYDASFDAVPGARKIVAGGRRIGHVGLLHHPPTQAHVAEALERLPERVF